MPISTKWAHKRKSKLTYLSLVVILKISEKCQEISMGQPNGPKECRCIRGFLISIIFFLSWEKFTCFGKGYTFILIEMHIHYGRHLLSLLTFEHFLGL